ncbi:hypothetical protein C8J57DRAFT_1326044 [Mycena rebaudengoi]|nr:hypothetical protein C8J57DRAFT_1326044 [Mycena rebaudengoi]
MLLPLPSPTNTSLLENLTYLFLDEFDNRLFCSQLLTLVSETLETLILIYARIDEPLVDLPHLPALRQVDFEVDRTLAQLIVGAITNLRQIAPAVDIVVKYTDYYSSPSAEEHIRGTIGFLVRSKNLLTAICRTSILIPTPNAARDMGPLF